MRIIKFISFIRIIFIFFIVVGGIAIKDLLSFRLCKSMKEYIKAKNLIYALMIIVIKHLHRLGNFLVYK